MEISVGLGTSYHNYSKQTLINITGASSSLTWLSSSFMLCVFFSAILDRSELAPKRCYEFGMQFLVRQFVRRKHMLERKHGYICNIV